MRQLKITKSITHRPSSSVDKYLEDIGKEELITADEEALLAQLIRDGDQLAFEKLCRANLRFVVSVAKQYQNQGLSLPDLINEGNLGLVKAAKRFDEKRGFKFISYAVWWIRQSILQALAENARIVRLPMNKQNDIRKVKKAIIVLEQEYEREPSPIEIAKYLELEEENVVTILAIKSEERDVSLDASVVGPEYETPFIETFSSDEPPTDFSLMISSLREEIRNVLNTLSEEEREIVILNFGLNHSCGISLLEISERMNMTLNDVENLKWRAIRRLRHPKRSKYLRKYL